MKNKKISFSPTFVKVLLSVSKEMRLYVITDTKQNCGNCGKNQCTLPGIFLTCEWSPVLCCAGDVAVCVLSATVAGQPEVDRNQAEHPGGVLPLARQPAASHLPLQTPCQLLQGPTRG